MPRRRPEPAPTGPGTTIALLYCRVSGEEQAREGISLPNQLRDARHYVARQPGWIIGREFQDVESGLHDARTDYQALLAEARRLRAEGHRVAVVVAALDRFGRRLLERVRSREELKALGVPTHSVRENGEVPDLIANVLAAVAEEESRRTGERIAAAARYIQDAGWHAGGRVPWGYTWRDATPAERAAGAPRRVPALDPPVVPYVQQLFEQVADGLSARKATQWLRTLPPSIKGGRLFNFGNVCAMLRLRTYIAQQADGRAGRWPALLAEPVWRRVQTQLADHRRVPRQASGRYLLTGFLWCPQGHRMSGAVGSKGLPTYACGRRTEVDCYETLSARIIDPQVRRELATLLAPLLALQEGPLRLALQDEWERSRRAPSAPAQRARRQTAVIAAERARERLRRAAVLYADGALDRLGYELVREEATAELAAAERQGAHRPPIEPTPRLPPLPAMLARVQAWDAALQGTDVALQRGVLRELVDRIKFRRLRIGVYALDITWTPVGKSLIRWLSARELSG